MRLRTLFFLSLATFYSITQPVYSQSNSAAQEHPAIGKYPGSILASHKATDYDVGKYPLTVNSYENYDDFKWKQLSGRRTSIVYDVPKNVTQSPVKVHISLEQGLKKNGFQIDLSCFAEAQAAECGYFFQRKLFSENKRKKLFDKFKDFQNLTSDEFGMISAFKNNINVWILVAKSRYSPVIQYAVDVFETEELQTEEIIVTEESLTNDMRDHGRAKLAGINFETNSAKLTNGSKAALAAIIAYIKQNPNTTYLVVGHTDNQGDYLANRRLSEQRALTVAFYLNHEGGIDLGRLRSVGVSFAAPIASNRLEKGRAENRRVELVFEGTNWPPR